MNRRESKMTIQEQQPELAEAANLFLLSLEASRSNEASLTISSFVRWCGAKRKPSSLAPAEVARFSQQFPPTDTELTQKMETLRKFLIYINKRKWTATSLAGHIKPRKAKSAKCRSGNGRPAQDPVYLTPEGYAALKEELVTLKARKPDIIKAIQLAAADKDFKENSPLAAAKEELGHVEGRINDLEETFKLAKVAEQYDSNRLQIGIGNRVTLRDNSSGDIHCYTIVTTREASPLKGKISDSSPLGRALIGRAAGEIVEISAPAGKICYKIETVGDSSG